MTPEFVIEQNPAVNQFVHIVETDSHGEMMFSLENLSAVRSFYNVSSEYTEEEAIQAIEDIRNASPEIDTTPSAMERIAAQLEYQNLIALPDTTKEE